MAVVGADNADRAALTTAAWRHAPAGSAIVAGWPDQPGLPLLADRDRIDGRETAYVCRHFVCRLPVTAVADLVAQLDGQG